MVFPPNCEEDLPRTLPLAEFVEQTAKQKAEHVFCQLNEEKITFDVIIGCDTMIFIDGKMIGKPRDPEDALTILKSLDGRTHSVRTGVCLIQREGRRELFSVETKVEFGKVGEQRLREYNATGEPMGRAGAYAIQGKGAVLVKAIHGSYTNVIGLPLYELEQKLIEMTY